MNAPEKQGPTSLSELLPLLLATEHESVMTPLPSTLRATMDYLHWTDDAIARMLRARAEGGCSYEALKQVADLIVEDAKGAGRQWASKLDEQEFVQRAHPVLTTKALAAVDAWAKVWFNSIENIPELEISLLQTKPVAVYVEDSGLFYEHLAILLSSIWKWCALNDKRAEGAG
ncbi:hypothetical protein [Citricoccus nitrophenolicus]|uniref:hypothetical protein n=1 Tax=Citricoccus nitrophenolicus TaxID=863575 RepID=UPI0031E9D956